jgi:hypothetical protein
VVKNLLFNMRQRTPKLESLKQIKFQKQWIVLKPMNFQISEYRTHSHATIRPKACVLRCRLCSKMQHFLPNPPVTLSYRKRLSFTFASRLKHWIPLLTFRRLPKSIREKWLLVSLLRSVFLSARNWTPKWSVFVIFQILDLRLNIWTHS